MSKLVNEVFIRGLAGVMGEHVALAVAAVREYEGGGYEWSARLGVAPALMGNVEANELVGRNGDEMNRGNSEKIFGPDTVHTLSMDFWRD